MPAALISVAARRPYQPVIHPDVSVRLVRVSVPHVDDSECPVFVSVCLKFEHVPHLDVSVRPVDASAPLQIVVDHPCRDVHERYSDENGTPRVVHKEDGHVHVRCRDVGDGDGDGGLRGGVRRAATDSGPFRAGTISGGRALCLPPAEARFQSLPTSS